MDEGQKGGSLPGTPTGSVMNYRNDHREHRSSADWSLPYASNDWRRTTTPFQMQMSGDTA